MIKYVYVFRLFNKIAKTKNDPQTVIDVLFSGVQREYTYP